MLSSKAIYIQSLTLMAESPTQGDSKLLSSNQGEGHLDTLLGGDGDHTSNLPVTSQPALPPELQLFYSNKSHHVVQSDDGIVIFCHRC